MPDFAALVRFIGTKRADIKSHVSVSETFLDHIWSTRAVTDFKALRATNILLTNLIRHMGNNWALLLALIFIRRGLTCATILRGGCEGTFCRSTYFATGRMRSVCVSSRSLESGRRQMCGAILRPP